LSSLGLEKLKPVDDEGTYVLGRVIEFSVGHAERQLVDFEVKKCAGDHLGGLK
jgi:hypothetical protein